MSNELILGQTNAITFVMVDATGTELTGLGTTFAIAISKNGGAFAVGAGTKAEIGSGWYSYVLTAAECNTIGPVSVKMTHASAVQQNIDCVVRSANAGAVAWVYTLTSAVGGAPIADAAVWVATDVDGANVVTEGRTDALGVVTLYLQTGSYYLFRSKSGWVFTQPQAINVP